MSVRCKNRPVSFRALGVGPGPAKSYWYQPVYDLEEYIRAVGTSKGTCEGAGNASERAAATTNRAVNFCILLEAESDDQ